MPTALFWRRPSPSANELEGASLAKNTDSIEESLLDLQKDMEEHSQPPIGRNDGRLLSLRCREIRVTCIHAFEINPRKTLDIRPVISS